tara:strand:- start:754 stop:1986 length:1233 start_codon:yes stop_codon:yes gene_type:complete
MSQLLGVLERVQAEDSNGSARESFDFDEGADELRVQAKQHLANLSIEDKLHLQRLAIEMEEPRLAYVFALETISHLYEIRSKGPIDSAMQLKIDRWQCLNNTYSEFSRALLLFSEQPDNKTMSSTYEDTTSIPDLIQCSITTHQREFTPSRMNPETYKFYQRLVTGEDFFWVLSKAKEYIGRYEAHAKANIILAEDYEKARETKMPGVVGDMRDSILGALAIFTDPPEVQERNIEGTCINLRSVWAKGMIDYLEYKLETSSPKEKRANLTELVRLSILGRYLNLHFSGPYKVGDEKWNIKETDKYMDLLIELGYEDDAWQAYGDAFSELHQQGVEYASKGRDADLPLQNKVIQGYHKVREMNKSRGNFLLGNFFERVDQKRAIEFYLETTKSKGSERYRVQARERLTKIL